ncbi:organic solvent ABC transporter permease [Marinobacter sp. 1_MG-2023]|uniref:organic solvent ABC transporter permease n=1 Tax=Marinobacter sp. 1_MG-2023 TaxID=3062627 RepID=UPI0026E1A7C8|nr:organic solvent ABC transporter permease [Marinobacter sp. 1_MG-2023]MDO6825128.1 organic solvent ABC transporter permease [Marinobacter sp. 1_MG-2023]
MSYQTASQTGITDANGQFHYYPGETISLQVGNLLIAEGVPAQEWVTPLEFIPEIRTQLEVPSVDDEGLSTHTITEQQLITRIPLTNLTRFLIALNWTDNLRENEGIEIRDRVIQQLNAALPNLTSPIDFTVSEAEFNATGNQPSPANQLLAAICFYPEGDELCEQPPTEEEINNAPERPEDEDDWDPNVDYKQDLSARRQRILEAVRSMDEVDAEDARLYLTRELNAISTTIGNRFYLDNHIARHPDSDTSIKQVKIRRIRGGLDLANLEAITTRPQDVVLHSFSWQTATVEYYVSGPTDGESEIVTSFLPEDTYRWVRKSLRVVITD